MLLGHPHSPFNAPPSNVPFEESAATEGQIDESNDAAAAVRLVILRSEKKKTSVMKT